MREIVIERVAAHAPRVEVVERKGIGHPDTICDALAEELSRRLSRHYLENFGSILHHNVDKALLVGGAAAPAFGGGRVLEPIRILLAGRATSAVGDQRIPIDEIAVRGSHEWIATHLHALDPEHVEISPMVRTGSTELVALVQEALANDTSIGVGYAPFSSLERTVLALSDHLARMPGDGSLEIGEDTKVMAVREGEHIRFTIACAFVDRHLRDLDAYLDRRARLQRALVDLASREMGREVDLVVNAADAGRDVFLTVTGTSAEAGDDGQVGRGNRVTGLITPMRPMTLEAAAGKNAISHVGKLYNVSAQEIASEIVKETDATSAECVLVSEIGKPIDEPQIASLRVCSHGDLRRAEEIARAGVARIPTLHERIIRGEVTLY